MKVRVHLEFFCPNCKHSHSVPVGGDGLQWAWNGDYINPTITPSVKISSTDENGKECVQCHFVVTDGVIHFQADFEGDLSGKSAPMRELFV